MSATFASDLRHRFGTIRDQGLRPTCLAFAASDLHGSALLPQQTLSVEYLYFHGIQRMPNRDPNIGISTTAVSAALAADGQPIEQSWPYLNLLPDDINLWIPPPNCQVYRRQFDLCDLTVDEICASLKTDKPVIMVLNITECFYTPSFEGALSPRSFDKIVGTHAVVAVGHGVIEGETSLYIRNSWGESWGVRGHAWLKKSYLEKTLIGNLSMR